MQIILFKNSIKCYSRLLPVFYHCLEKNVIEILLSSSVWDSVLNKTVILMTIYKNLSGLIKLYCLEF